MMLAYILNVNGFSKLSGIYICENSDATNKTATAEITNPVLRIIFICLFNKIKLWFVE